MHIRYGFDIELSLSQPTAVVTLMDVHSSRRRDVVQERRLRVNQDIIAKSSWTRWAIYAVDCLRTQDP